MTDPLKRNAHLVEALGSALREGEHGLGTVPGLLKRVLSEESWREFVTQRGEHTEHERFVDFVTTPPLKGLGASVDLVRALCRDDPKALDLLDQALQNPPHVHIGQSDSDVITINPDPSPRGTSREGALRRLRKDAPELHAEVLAGRLTAHGAMVKAGYRPKTFSVRTDSAEAVARALRRQLDADTLAAVLRLLSDPG